MPTNRDFLIAQRRRQKGLPVSINPTTTEPIKKADLGLATKGIKDIATPFKKRFKGLEPEQPVSEERFTNTFQGKPIPEEVGLPSNVNIAPKIITRPSARGVSSFGLPTGRLPSFAELGGAIGQMFKFVGGLTKKRQALGLIPGTVTTPGRGKGFSLTQKDRATILAKRLDDINLTPDERIDIKKELDKILNPARAAEQTDIEAILSE
jgi:hypothetical protein